MTWLIQALAPGQVILMPRFKLAGKECPGLNLQPQTPTDPVCGRGPCRVGVMTALFGVPAYTLSCSS